MAEPIRCSKCMRRYRGTDDWVTTTVGGVITGRLCPECSQQEQSTTAPPDDGAVK